MKMLSEDQITYLRKCHPVRWVVTQRHEEFCQDEEIAAAYREFTGREFPFVKLVLNPLAGLPRKFVRA